LWAQNSGAIYQDEDTGAVVYTAETKNLRAGDITGACPYDVPRSADNGPLVKCTMCNDRVKRGMAPACVKTCPTGTMNFGQLEDMQAMALERLEQVKSDFPDAQLLDEDNVRVIFLTAFAPDKYHKYAVSFDPQKWKLRKM
jgi:formate dehydrogenase iron-sulfur subunit